MWKGIKASFYPGSVAYLDGLQDQAYANQPATIICFNADKARWVVQLLHDDFGKKKLLVREEMLNFAYCLLPQSISVAKGQDSAGRLADMGECGRGLIAVAPCGLGEVIFEEHPFLISGADEKSSWRGRSRWFAYVSLQRGAAGSEHVRQALRCFEDLSAGTPPADRRDEVSKEAALLLPAARSTSGEHAGLLRMIREVLLIWQANQFEFYNGSGLRASALYSRGCMLNHSCSPTTRLVCKFEDESIPGALQEGNGRLEVSALHALEAGAELSHNYGPPELLHWPLARRRQYLQALYGFTCRCARCNAEELPERQHQQQAPLESAHGGEGPGFLACMD